MERAQRDNQTIGSVIAPVELLSDSQNWPEVPYDYLFINQSQDKPEKTAVVFGEDVLTYRELELQSRQWAYWLLSEGIKTGDKVLVCMERALELPAVLLGILRAGACYVPADPAFPSDRIAVIIEDSDSAAVISDRESEALLPPSNPSVRFVVEDKPAQLEARSLPEWRPDDLAYLIFTSGSTGRPKGVPITRAAMMNFLLAMADKPGIAAEDRVLALTTISFDISVLELFLPLIAGATVYVVSKRDSLDPQSLSRVIDENRLTLMQATPATWRLLYDYGWRPQRHQKLLCGGEAFPLSLANGLVACAGEVWNMYGPTEATVWSSCHQVSEADLSTGRIPLGKPLPNIEYVVCDSNGNRVPKNDAGELWIGGVALTPGYYHRPELTEDRFVSASGFGRAERFYRTGDLVSVLGNGDLVYLDRLDNQVKIRGHRIELGEIEAVLRQVDEVQDAIVVKTNDEINEPVLVGFIRPKVAPDDESLTKMLSSVLPTYMIPTVWFRVDEFPETPNRKVDRRKLRESLPKNFLQASPEVNTVPIRNERACETLGAGFRESAYPCQSYFPLHGRTLLVCSAFKRPRGARLQMLDRTGPISRDSASI